jgi:chemotaxis protein MotB
VSAKPAAGSHGGAAQPVIRIVKKHGKHDAHHGGAWKVAYADFVTAMMAFFMVMWLVNQTEEVKKAVGGYFRDPVGFSERPGGRSAQGGEGPFDGSPDAVPAEAGLTGASLMPEPIPFGSARKPEPEPEESLDALREAGEAIRQALAEEREFAAIAHLVDIEVTKEGLRIELMEAGSETFFQSGSSELSTRGREVLGMIGSKLMDLGRNVVVEGHTDSVPYANGTGSYSNWDLSSERANSARRVLEVSGIEAGRIEEIRGYASRRPRFADTRDPRNRRVAILVPQSTSESLH